MSEEHTQVPDVEDDPEITQLIKALIAILGRSTPVVALHPEASYDVKRLVETDAIRIRGDRPKKRFLASARRHPEAAVYLHEVRLAGKFIHELLCELGE